MEAVMEAVMNQDSQSTHGKRTLSAFFIMSAPLARTSLFCMALFICAHVLALPAMCSVETGLCKDNVFSCFRTSEALDLRTFSWLLGKCLP